MRNCTLRINSAGSLRRRVWRAVQSSPATYVFALIPILLFGSSRAKADVVDTYVFSSDATTDLGGHGNTEAITGGFTFDATTGAIEPTLTDHVRRW